MRSWYKCVVVLVTSLAMLPVLGVQADDLFNAARRGPVERVQELLRGDHGEEKNVVDKYPDVVTGLKKILESEFKTKLG